MTGPTAGTSRRGAQHRWVVGAIGAASLVTGCLRSHRAAPALRAGTFDRTQPPVIGPPPALVLPPVITRRLANGLRLVIVQRHELPLADFILVARRGSEGDPEGKAGVATLTADLLMRGTTTRSAAEIAEQQAVLGITLRAGSGWDRTLIAMHTPTDQLDSALALFADVTLRPAFAGPELDRARHERIAQLIERGDQGPLVAARVQAAILYGPQRAYGHTVLGTEASVSKITREDLEAFYDATFRARTATLIAVGDVRPEDVVRRANTLFGGWTAPADVADSGRRSETTSGGVPPAPTTIYLVDKPDAPQSSVRVAAVGVARDTPDYFAVTVLNSALGGAFTSRLNQNLREAHGYTYGAFTDFDMRREPGPFSAAAEVVATKTDSSLFEFMHELKAIRDTIPIAELDKTKRYLELGLPEDFETTSGIAGQLVAVVVYDLPDDFYDTYQARVGAVTQGDVQRVARRYIDPTRMVVVVVGDRKSLEEPLRATGIGPVEIRGSDGAPTH